VFTDIVRSVEELRELYRPPGKGAVLKQIDSLDHNCRSFIAHAPFVLVATADADGTCDLSPKGGPPGFVVVLDDTHLVIPELLGNNRLDSMHNLLTNPGIALLFVIPGVEETLRVNGRGLVVRDADVLDRCVLHDRRPKTVIGVEVEAAYIHCAKAFRRSDLWQPDRWPDVSGMPTVACMLRDHIGAPMSGEELSAVLEEGYAKTLW
jgi:PPOX class probable FMN-dependent enzyme